jgi:ribulose-phosphate 3-epimerase
MNILPAILATDENDFREKAARVFGLGLPVHVDVMDGNFVPGTSWAVPELMKKILGDLPFEAHLMVSNPEHLVPVWLAAGAARVYYHAESTHADPYIVRSIVPDGVRLGVAINPETPVSRIIPLLEDIGNVLVMGVNPGKQGQPFQHIALEKVAAIRGARPAVMIGVDGGVKPEIAKAALDAGADMIVAGSALTNQPSPAEALRLFQDALGQG